MQNCDQIVKFRHHHQSHPSESRADEEGAERGVLGWAEDLSIGKCNLRINSNGNNAIVIRMTTQPPNNNCC